MIVGQCMEFIFQTKTFLIIIINYAQQNHGSPTCGIMSMITGLIIYIKWFLHFDWLTVSRFIPDSEKSEISGTKDEWQLVKLTK